MFVQVIRGQVSDAAAVRAAYERWVADLAPGATGWLGSTGGVTDDGRFVGVARFESGEAARANSDRPEQGEWWEETSKHFTGDVSFRDSTQVHADLVGSPDDAGFVQVMDGRGRDPERAWELITQDSPEFAEFRPDILGTLMVGHDDGGYTMVGYFTSEAEAREGEKKEPPEEMKAMMDELNSLADGPPEFLDIRDPWLYSPS